MRNRFLALLAALTIVLGALPGLAWADAVRGELGQAPVVRLDAASVLPPGEGLSAQADYATPRVQGVSPAQIKAYFDAVGFDTAARPQPVFASQPSVRAPYARGAMAQSSLDEALVAVNAVRYLAGLDANVTLDERYNQLCQASAVVNAANDTLTHTPAQPSGMDAALYQDGYEGSSHSNIAAGYSSLPYSVWGAYMEDSDIYNIEVVGHRRWILNPAMGKTGFGAAWAASGTSYGMFSAMYAMDMSNTSATAGEVVWPAQNMPVEMFGDSWAWSISLPYFVTKDAPQVTVERARDGRTWRFSSAAADGFFNVDGVRTGNSFTYVGEQGSCVIFRPDGIGIEKGDAYTVTLDGVERPLQYTVKFFSLSDRNLEGGDEPVGPTDPAEPVDDPADPTDEPAATFGDVPANAWYRASAEKAAALGLVKGYEDGTFRGGRSLTRAQAAVMLWRWYEPAAEAAYAGTQATTFNQTGMLDVRHCDWYTGAANWAVRCGVINGKQDADTGQRRFAPNATITRQELFAMLANCAERFGGANVDGADLTAARAMADWASVDGWAQRSAAWCVNEEVVHGSQQPDGRVLLEPRKNVTRAQAAAMLVNAVEQGAL